VKHLALLLALLSPAAFAQPDPELVKSTLEKAPRCENFVRFDDQYLFLGFGRYRKMFEEPRQPIPGHLEVIPLGRNDRAFSLPTADAAIDVTREGDSLFVLTYSSIEEWSLTAKTRVASYATYAYGGTMAYKEHAEAFARVGDRLIVAHGRLGVSFFDLKTRRLTNQFRLVQGQRPLESMATGVSVSDGVAYVALDNFSLVPNGKPAFRGIVKIDMASERVLSELDGMDPGADALVADGTKAIVSFGGNPVWKYSLESLAGRSLPEPLLRVWKFPRAGNPTGRPALDAKYYYSCFTAAPEKPGGPYKNIPLALDRAAIHLD
jgi:hypothetical protein